MQSWLVALRRQSWNLCAGVFMTGPSSLWLFSPAPVARIRPPFIRTIRYVLQTVKFVSVVCRAVSFDKCLLSYHSERDVPLFPTPAASCLFADNPALSLALGNHDWFSVSVILLYLEWSVNGIIWNVSIYVWHLPLNIFHLGVVLVVYVGSSIIVWMNELPFWLAAQLSGIQLVSDFW